MVFFQPRHLYYSSPRIHLARLREIAAKHAAGDSRNPPVTSTVHHHAKGEDCSTKCETFEPKEN